jgi:hypothetical protein
MYVAARYKLVSLPFIFFYLTISFLRATFKWCQFFFYAMLGFTFHYGGNFRPCLQHCALLPDSVNACLG